MLRSLRLRAPLAILALAVAALSSAQYAGAKPVPSELKAGWDSMAQADARAFLTRLSSKEFGGRGTGQHGFLKAAQFVADQMKSFGVKGGMPDGSYFQMVPFTQWSSSPASRATLPNGKTLRPGTDFNASGLTADYKVSAPVAYFAGSAANLTFTEESVGGKIVVVDSPDMNRRLLGTAFRAKALAVVQVLDQADNEPAVSPGNDAQSRGNQAKFQMSRAVFREMVKARGQNAGNMSIDWKIEKQNVGVPNVIGKIEGSDPVLKNEFIGMGSHLDHLGITDGVIWPGADDDGSGSTALLLLAKAFMTSPVKPKRTLVFMAFCGEEMGLIGSRYMAGNFPYDINKMSCELQMDMVGRNEQAGSENGDSGEKASDNIDHIHLVGSKRISTELHELTMKANEHIGFTFEYDEEDVYTRSDHAMFAQKGVPITFLFSGFHPDYHQPTDTIEKINFEKIVSSARLNYLVANWAANMPAMLKRDVPGA